MGGVRVGLFIPPSEIKISFVAFHFRCLIQFDHLPSIRSIHHLKERFCYSCPSCHVPAGLCLFIEIIHNHLLSCLVSWSTKSHFRVFSPTRSRVSSSKCLIMPAGTWGRLKISFHGKKFIVIMIDHDFSSKICFEEKSSILSFVINVM